MTSLRTLRVVCAAVRAARWGGPYDTASSPLLVSCQRRGTCIVNDAAAPCRDRERRRTKTLSFSAGARRSPESSGVVTGDLELARKNRRGCL